MRSGLSRRLAKLEARRNPSTHNFPCLIFSRADIAAELITGYRADGAATVARSAGEALSALQARARQVIGGRHLFAVYDGSDGG